MDKQVHFYYSFRGDENAVYLDLLRDYAQKNPNFELHLVDSRKGGYLNFDQEEVPEHASVYMCGPLSMMKSLSKQIKKQNPKVEPYLMKDSSSNNYSYSPGMSQEFFYSTAKNTARFLAVFEFHLS